MLSNYYQSGNCYNGQLCQEVKKRMYLTHFDIMADSFCMDESISKLLTSKIF